MKTPKIMMFEDDTFIMGMYKKIFKEAGFNLIWYEYPPKNLVEITLKEQPDLISMSVIMPHMDGFTAAELLKKDFRTKNIPLVFLTTMGQNNDVEKGLSIGADDYLIKANWTPSEIILKYRSIIDNQEMEDTKQDYHNKPLSSLPPEKENNTIKKNDFESFNFWKACGGYFIITLLVLLVIVLINEHNIVGDEFWGIFIISLFIAPILAYFTKWMFEIKQKFKKNIKEKGGLEKNLTQNFEYMNRKKQYRLIILAALVIIGFIFYWYELRPGFIRKSCAHEASAQWNFNSDAWNVIYFICLHGKGMEK